MNVVPKRQTANGKQQGDPTFVGRQWRGRGKIRNPFDTAKWERLSRLKKPQEREHGKIRQNERTRERKQGKTSECKMINYARNIDTDSDKQSESDLEHE